MEGCPKVRPPRGPARPRPRDRDRDGAADAAGVAGGEGAAAPGRGFDDAMGLPKWGCSGDFLMRIYHDLIHIK